LFFSPACLFAAPFSEFITFTQPDNTQITLWGEGDEFHADFETTTGFSVIFDPQQKAYFYAKRSADGNNLLSTGVLAHGQAPHGLTQHVRINPDAAKAKARARHTQWESDVELPERWSRLKAQSLGAEITTDESGPALSPPTSATIGAKVGLTLLIDFSDAPATFPQSSFEAFLNGDGYAENGNNGSVKKYFSDVSNGRLTYTNVVTLYVRMDQPRSYYNDTTKDSGTQGRLLINDALTILKARGDYNSTILPTFDSLTVDGSNRVVAFNVFFAGSNSGVWSMGLWPHSWALASSVALGNGKTVRSYQITNIGAYPTIGTFNHENGHMLCGFPDLYDYGSDSKGGAGYFSLMGYGNNLGSGKNPGQVDAYLKLAAGWATAIDITSSSNLIGTLIAAPNIGYNTFYRYRKPGVATEYYLLENRQKTGRDLNLPASGVAIWHVDQLGDRDNQSLVPNSTHQNYELTLVQADNLWHFQNNTSGYGDVSDLYFLGNSATAYTNRLDDASSPNGHWWDGSASSININTFSASGMSMTFNMGTPPTTPGAPTITSAKAGNGLASIYLAPPASDGGSPITGYTVTSGVGTTAPSSIIPVYVSSLSNGVSYTFTAKALNDVGQSSSSFVSNTVIPGLVLNYGYDATGYQTIQNAYNADTHTSEIQIAAGATVGGLVKADSDQVLIRGGYDPSFSTYSGPPSILSKVQLKDGITRFQNVVIR
jgi:M6 family metalloprotease-like protein